MTNINEMINYEINGVIKDENGNLELYTLDNTGSIDNTNKVKYTDFVEANKIKKADLKRFLSVTMYRWVKDDIKNTYFIK